MPWHNLIPGQAISAAMLNEIASRAEQFISADGLDLKQTKGSLAIASPGEREIYARLTSTAGSGAAGDACYDWEEVYWDFTGAAWAALNGGRTGTKAALPAKEIGDSTDVPLGTIVVLRLDSGQQWYGFAAGELCGSGDGYRHARWKNPSGGGTSRTLENALIEDGEYSRYVRLLSRLAVFSSGITCDGIMDDVDITCGQGAIQEPCPTLVELVPAAGPPMSTSAIINGFAGHYDLHGLLLLLVNTSDIGGGGATFVATITHGGGGAGNIVYNNKADGSGFDLQLGPGQCALYVYMNDPGHMAVGWRLITTTEPVGGGAGIAVIDGGTW